MLSSIFDVAIIGYGPAGATLANQLGQLGLSVLVLEKDAEIYALPRAIHFDGEVMRVFETAGLRKPIEAISRPGQKGMHFNNAQGETLLIRGGTSPHGPHGCANNYYFHQPELEQVLREGVKRYPQVVVRTQHEVTAIEEVGAHVALQVLNATTQSKYTVHAKYVVGCDGARSFVRKVLGTTMMDLGLHQPWLVFDVLLKDNAPELPDHTVQHCDPARPMTYCNVTRNRRRWEIMLMPGDDPQELVKPHTLWRLVSKWIQPQHADIERAVIYTFHSVIADHWRKGRLLLAGDAAHQTPPFLGQGMCAAIRDAANLAWKLEAVLLHGVEDALLDTYQSERAPHVHAFIDLAVKLGDIIQTTDPEAARARDAKFKAGQPEIFQFPAPKLGAGVWVNDHPLAGQIFPQPMVDAPSSKGLDQVLQNHFAVIADPALLQQVDADTLEAWQHNQVVQVPWTAPELHAWFVQNKVAAVLLRPDRYILGVAQDLQDLVQLTQQLPKQTKAVH